MCESTLTEVGEARGNIYVTRKSTARECIVTELLETLGESDSREAHGACKRTHTDSVDVTFIGKANGCKVGTTAESIFIYESERYGESELGYGSVCKRSRANIVKSTVLREAYALDTRVYKGVRLYLSYRRGYSYLGKLGAECERALGNSGKTRAESSRREVARAVKCVGTERVYCVRDGYRSESGARERKASDNLNLAELYVSGKSKRKCVVTNGGNALGNSVIAGNACGVCKECAARCVEEDTVHTLVALVESVHGDRVQRGRTVECRAVERYYLLGYLDPRERGAVCKCLGAYSLERGRAEEGYRRKPYVVIESFFSDRYYPLGYLNLSET